MQEYKLEIVRHPEYGHVEMRSCGQVEITIEGVARVSGLNVPISKTIGLMGILWSITKDMVNEFHKFDVGMTCLERETPESDYVLCFNYNNVLDEREVPEEFSEQQKINYVKNFNNIMNLFNAVLMAFVKDPLGLDEYVNYISSTHDPAEIQLEYVKKLRDDVMVRKKIRTKKQIKAKELYRKAKQAMVEAENKTAAQRIHSLTSESLPTLTVSPCDDD